MVDTTKRALVLASVAWASGLRFRPASAQGILTPPMQVFGDSFVAANNTRLHARSTSGQMWQVDGSSAEDVASWNIVQGTLGIKTSLLSTAFVDAGGADNVSQANFLQGSAAVFTGIATRIVDRSNLIYVRPYSFGPTGQLACRKIVGGKDFDIASGLISPPGGVNATDVFAVQASGDSPVSITVYKNGAQVAGPYLVNDVLFTGVTKTGLIGKGATTLGFTNFVTGVLGPSSLVATTPIMIRSVLQRDSTAVTGGSNVRTYAYALAYQGAMPSCVQWKLVNQSDLSVAQDWTTIASPTIGGGSITGLSVLLPTNGQAGAYYLLTRTLDASMNVLSTQRSAQFSVGVVIDCAGQSNMAGRFGSQSQVVPIAGTNVIWHSSTNVYHWNNVTYTSGAGSMANAISEFLGCPIALFNSAVSATTITSHCPAGTYNTLKVPTASPLWTAELALIDAVGGDVEIILWDQGETGAPSADPRGYTLAYNARTNAIRAKTGRSAAQLPTFLANLSYALGATNASIDASRLALAIVGNGQNDSYLSNDTVSLPKQSGDLHMNGQGFTESGNRFARSIGYLYGTSTIDGRGPRFAGTFTQDPTTFVVTAPLDLRGHASLTGNAPLQGIGYFSGGAWHDSGSNGNGNGPTDAAISGNAIVFTATGTVSAVRFGSGLRPFNSATILADNPNIPRGDLFADTTSTFPISVEPTRSNLVFGG